MAMVGFHGGGGGGVVVVVVVVVFKGSEVVVRFDDVKFVGIVIFEFVVSLLLDGEDVVLDDEDVVLDSVVVELLSLLVLVLGGGAAVVVSFVDETFEERREE